MFNKIDFNLIIINKCLIYKVYYVQCIFEIQIEVQTAIYQENKNSQLRVLKILLKWRHRK